MGSTAVPANVSRPIAEELSSFTRHLQAANKAR